MDSKVSEEQWKLYVLGSKSLDALATIFQNFEDMQKEPQKDTKDVEKVTVRVSGFRESSETISHGFYTRDEIYRICPLLAALSNAINQYFTTWPESFEETYYHSIEIVQVPFGKFQSLCKDYLANSKLNLYITAPAQIEHLAFICSLSTEITNFPHIERWDIDYNDVKTVILASERLIKAISQYEESKVEVPGFKFRLEKAQITAFLDAFVAVSSKLEDKTSTQIDRTLTLDKIWNSSKSRMNNQLFTMPDKPNHYLGASLISKIIEKQAKHRLGNQDWSSPTILRHDDMDVLGQKMNNSLKTYENQSFVPSDQKQKILFLGKVDSQIEKLGPRFDKQTALTREDNKLQKFDEFDKILDKTRQRYDKQYAGPPSHEVKTKQIALPLKEGSPRLSVSHIVGKLSSHRKRASTVIGEMFRSKETPSGFQSDVKASSQNEAIQGSCHSLSAAI